MSDAFDPKAFLAEPSQPKDDVFDPKAFLKDDSATDGAARLLQKAIEPITSYPETYAHMNKEAREQMSTGLGQLAGTTETGGWAEKNLGKTITGAGNLALGSLGYVGSPISAGLRTVVGKPIEENTGIPKEYSEFAASLAIPGIGLRSALPSVPSIPSTRVIVPPREPAGPLGVTLSKGQKTGELPLIQREQAASRGELGKPAQNRANEFFEQQRAETQAAKEGVSRNLDEFGETIAEGPQQAGQIVSDAMRREAATAKAGVTASYDAAKVMPGEIHAGAFEGIGQKIKGNLSLGDNPVIIDDKLTPYASKAIQDIENRVAALKIQNRADPFGQPNPENITGINLTGVDQMRKRLSAFRNDAFGSGNLSDGRAAKAVLDSFDKQIDSAVNGGLFSGDHRAVQAWNDARAAHADYAGTFRAAKGDPVGRVVERILGKNKAEPAVGNDVADFMYGAVGTNPNSLNVGVAKRIKTVLGENSPEWSGAKQGLFSRLVETPKDVKDWGPGKVADRIYKFLNGDGKEMSQVMFSPSERTILQNYANLQRTLEIPQRGANWSNSAAGVAPMLKKVGTTLGVVVGSLLGHKTGMPWGLGEAAGYGAAKATSKIGDVIEARKIAKQLPLVSQSVKQYQRAMAAAIKADSPQTSRTASLAYMNLGRSLEPLGIKLESLFSGQGALPAAADQQQTP